MSDVLLEIVEEAGASSIVMEAERDREWRAEIHQFRHKAPTVRVNVWTTVLTAAGTVLDKGYQVPAIDDWKELSVLSSIPENFEAGTLPDLNAFQDLLLTANDENQKEHPAILDLFGRKQTVGRMELSIDV